MRMKGYTYRDMADILRKNGWEINHRKSSHVSFKKSNCDKIVTIVADKKELSRPLCKRLLKEAGINY